MSRTRSKKPTPPVADGPIRYLFESSSYIHLYSDAEGWRLEHWAKRWGGQQWEWKPNVSTGPSIRTCAAAVLGDLYGIDADAVATELERRAAVKTGP